MELLGWILVVIVGVFVAFFLLTVVVFFAMRRKMRQIGAALQASVGSDMPRYRVHLEPLAEFEWHDEAASERSVTQLAAARFGEAGRFTLHENPTARLVGMASEPDSLYAVVYELTGGGPHVDLVGRYDDGRWLTVTNVPEPGLDEPDERVTLRFPGADAAELVTKARDERPAGTLVAVDLDDFAAAFEEGYAAEMDWRAARGGFNRSEVTHASHIQAEALDDDEITVDKATVDLMLSTFNLTLFNGVDEALRERLEATIDLSVAEWEEVRDRLVFVYDNLPATLLRARLRECLPSAAGNAEPESDRSDDHAAESHDEASAASDDQPTDDDLPFITDRDSFAAAIDAAGTLVSEAAPAKDAGEPANGTSDDGQPRLLGTVDEPFAADVYVRPA